MPAELHLEDKKSIRGIPGSCGTGLKIFQCRVRTSTAARSKLCLTVVVQNS